MIVVDTGGVLASRDEAHPEHATVARLLRNNNENLLLSPFVLAECDYMLATRLGDGAAREFLDDVANGAFQLVEYDAGDVATALGLIDRYRDLSLGITDASLVVIAARYETTRILSFDHRHLRAVSPLWGAPSFTLVPTDEDER
ncbi:type II toxin-antitoxin system VapC family toxin [Saccharomonospora halophila]|uniref:type II toxin-antitoxin system VapC family toxin n=1 Tax=Saccharomonospora halophila TaxID=129922 RepID=UPI0003663D96|nr:PIN domain-containing protein [Saccharomonospora halophila]